MYDKYLQDKFSLIAKEKQKGCIVCGKHKKLEFHHLHGKKDNVSRLKVMGSLHELKSELAKCVVLCHDCHVKIHQEKMTLIENYKTLERVYTNGD